MSRKFGNNDQQYQVQNDTTMTNKQRLYAIVGFVCLLIFGFYNMRNQYMNAEEPPVEQVTQTNEQAVEDIYEEPASETDETDIAEQDIEEEPVQTIQYAFDYQWDYDYLKEKQDEILKTYDYLKSEGYDMPDWGCALTDTFDLDDEGHAVNYHTKNEYHAGLYETYYDAKWNGDLIAHKRLIDIVNVDSGWFYEPDEPTDVILERLFGKSNDEDFFHLRSRLIDYGCAIYVNEKDRASSLYFNVDTETMQIGYNTHWFRDLYGNNSDSQMFKHMCLLVDEYDNCRVSDLMLKAGIVKEYIDKQAGYTDDIVFLK